MMHTYKSITMPVPAKAEHNRDVFLMEEKKFVEFAKALRLRCYPDLLEAYERKKLLFPHARVVRPRRLEERAYKLRYDTKPLSIRSNEYRHFIEFDDIQRKYSVSGLSSPSRLGIINSIMKEGHPISRSLRGELAPGVVQRPQERRFRSWKTWFFDYPGGPRLNRADHCYGWWQVLELYELEYINLQIENPASSIKPKIEDKRLFKALRWKIRHRDINPPTPINFDPNREPVDETWPSAWSCWSPWIERAADFDWRSYASLQCYSWQLSDGGVIEEEWNLHLQREIEAAKILTEGTCNDDWIRLLRALCRFKNHLAEEGQVLLRLVVHNIIHKVADLLQVAFNKDLRQLAMEHDGLASQRPGLRLVDGADVQPWHLLVVLNEKFYIIDRFARPLFAYHFEQLQHRLATKLLPDCATSLLETLISVYNEPLISALASYERVERLENGSPWSNQQRWAAIRALLVATESETRRWFKKDSLFDVFLELFPGDKTSIGWQKCWHKFLGKHSLAAKKLDSTDKFCALLYDTMAVVEERGERQVERLDYHILVVNFSRNWSAHNGLNPPPNTAYLGTGVLTSVMRTLFIAWEACRHRPENKENLYKIYPGTAQGF
jgi:hypothetical protein